MGPPTPPLHHADTMLPARAEISRRQRPTRDEINEILDRYEKLPTKDQRPMAEIIDYDERGLPK